MSTAPKYAVADNGRVYVLLHINKEQTWGVLPAIGDVSGLNVVLLPKAKKGASGQVTEKWPRL